MATGEPVCPRCGRMMINSMEHKHMNCSPNKLPTVDDIVGLEPNFTGGVPSEEYVRQIRDGNTLPWPAEIDRLRTELAEIHAKMANVTEAEVWEALTTTEGGEGFEFTHDVNQQEIDRLKAENAMLRGALITVGRGKFGAKRIPANTGDIFLALSIFVRQTLETAQHTGSDTDRKQDVEVC